MPNREKYSREIANLRKDIPKYAGMSLIVGGLIFIAGQGLLNFIPHDASTTAGRMMDVMFTYALPFLTWHQLYLIAENKMSALKQKIRDSQIFVEYTKFEKFINATMILHDNSPLP